MAQSFATAGLARLLAVLACPKQREGNPCKRHCYAFHAAYWHDAFGAPKSHGCVNLSPIDARWLFHFTEPPVPRGWHGAFSLREGTLVSIGP
jgi:hypothetical protein